jgi:hypothetical protein
VRTSSVRFEHLLEVCTKTQVREEMNSLLELDSSFTVWMNGVQALFNIDPERAKYDPIIVHNVPFYKATLQLEAEVNQMQPPPRPANWGVCSLHTFDSFQKCDC